MRDALRILCLLSLAGPPAPGRPGGLLRDALAPPPVFSEHNFSRLGYGVKGSLGRALFKELTATYGLDPAIAWDAVAAAGDVSKQNTTAMGFRRDDPQIDAIRGWLRRLIRARVAAGNRRLLLVEAGLGAAIATSVTARLETSGILYAAADALRDEGQTPADWKVYLFAMDILDQALGPARRALHEQTILRPALRWAAAQADFADSEQIEAARHYMRHWLERHVPAARTWPVDVLFFRNVSYFNLHSWLPHTYFNVRPEALRLTEWARLLGGFIQLHHLAAAFAQNGAALVVDAAWSYDYPASPTGRWFAPPGTRPLALSAVAPDRAAAMNIPAGSPRDMASGLLEVSDAQAMKKMTLSQYWSATAATGWGLDEPLRALSASPGAFGGYHFGSISGAQVEREILRAQNEGRVFPISRVELDIAPRLSRQVRVLGVKARRAWPALFFRPNDLAFRAYYVRRHAGKKIDLFIGQHLLWLLTEEPDPAHRYSLDSLVYRIAHDAPVTDQFQERTWLRRFLRRLYQSAARHRTSLALPPAVRITRGNRLVPASPSEADAFAWALRHAA